MSGAGREPGVGADTGRRDAAEQRVSTVSADRPCTRCAYNLVGQPVLRESRYQLLIVRCPECGTVAALQEYPLLGRWATRWGMALAALWILAMAPAIVLSIWMLVGYSSLVASAASSSAMGKAQASLQQWSEATHPGTPLWQLPQNDQIKTLDAWWAAVGGPAGFAKSQGGWVGLVDWWRLPVLLPGMLVAAAIGAAWSVVLLGIPRRGLWRVGALLVLLAAGTVAVAVLVGGSERRFGGGQTWYNELSAFTELRVEYPIWIASLLLLCAALAAGLWLGRPLLRLLVRAVVPPRLRWGLAVLWTAEGLPPPPGDAVDR